MGKITRRWSGNDPCGSCGGTGRVVALLLRGSADPLSNGGGRGGRASRSACPRQRGTRRDRTLRGGPQRRSRQRSSAHPGRTRRGSRGCLALLDGLRPSSRVCPRSASPGGRAPGTPRLAAGAADSVPGAEPLDPRNSWWPTALVSAVTVGPSPPDPRYWVAGVADSLGRLELGSCVLVHDVCGGVCET